MNRHYAILDPIRFAAALLVFAFHCAYLFSTDEAVAAAGLGFLRGGWIGVDLFFAISGFVVGLAAQRDWHQTPGAFPGRFLARRAVRIVPLYLLTGLVYLAFVDDAALRGDSWLRQAISHLSFTHNFWPDTMLSINPPSWSLAHEVQLYLVLALLTPWLVGRKPSTILALAFALAIAWRCAAYLALRHTDATLLQHYAFATPGMIDSFGAGVALAAWHWRGGGNLPRWRNLAWVGLLALAAALLAAADATAAIDDGSIWHTPVRALLLRSFVAAGVALFLLAALAAGTRLASAGAVWRHLGDISYGIYLWHAIVLMLISKWLDAAIPIRCAAALLATLALAELTLWLVERPILRRARARLAG